MLVKSIEDENFTNYKEPSMTIGCISCDFKCCNEAHIDKSVCLNNLIINQKNIEVSPQYIYNRYINNPITHALVFAGLEPMLQIDEIIDVINYFRKYCNDTIIIYTGYYEDEIQLQLHKLKQYDNIIVKFGRYIPNKSNKYDNILGITLISNNQYAKYINKKENK